MIKGFNGIRAIAVLMVLITHFKLSDYLFFNHDVSSITSGTTGVYIFFCLSGFLITYILLKELELKKIINIKYFLIRRILRLLPVMLLYCLIVFLLMIFGYIEYNLPSIVYALTYTTNFSLKKYYNPLLYHFWSLGVEEHFYLFYPFVFALKSKVKILIVLFILIMFSLIVKILQVNYILYMKELTENYRWTIPSILPILMGAIMSLSLTYSKIKSYIENRKLLLLLIGVLLFINELFISNIYVVKFGLNYLGQSIGISFILTFIFIQQESVFVKILETKPLVFIGKISYGLYIWHVLFAYLVFSKNLNIYLGLLLSFITSIVSYYTIEKYFLSKKIIYTTH